MTTPRSAYAAATPSPVLTWVSQLGHLELNSLILRKCAVWCYARRGSDVKYRAMRSLVLIWHMVLRACYVKPGTDLA
eukprot:325222-Rhodomonas_salina.1